VIQFNMDEPTAASEIKQITILTHEVAKLIYE
jgi:hypothetical protein